VNIIVLSGQGGWVTSPGIATLADELRSYGEVEKYFWDSPQALASAATHLRRSHRLVVVGYSLGGNQLGWMNKYFDEAGIKSQLEVDLGVAIDPSWLSPLCYRDQHGDYIQYAPRFRRLVCFWNKGAWWHGGSRYKGENVETVQVSGAHLMLQFDKDIRNRVISEVAQLEVQA
jgi:hypothetical protein